MRYRLRRFKLNIVSIIDVMYPANDVVGQLVYNDYVDTAKAVLAEHWLTPIEDFNPVSPDVIHDPKLKSESIEVRTQKAKDLHLNRLENSLKFIRAPVNYAVARDF